MSARPWRLLAMLALAWLVPRAWAAEPVTLQLKWSHAFQFAGYYAAKAQGYYQDAGFDVTIREAQPGENVVEEVLSGRAQFGVGTSSLLLERHAGRPVVVLAAIFQHSPYVLIARSDRGIQNVHDLSGRRLMMEPLSEELLAYLQREGMRPKDFQRLEHSFDVQDLVQGRTDAISAYVINQPYDLKRLGVPFMEFSPRSSGVDFYGDNLFTSQEWVRERPERVAAFRAASLRGWDYAMAHPEEVARLIRERYSTRHELGYLLFQAERMGELIQADVVPLGYMHEGRWRHIAETYAALGMLPRDVPLEGFLYESAPGVDLRGWWAITGGVLAALAVAAGVLLHIAGINRRLQTDIAERQRAQAALAASEAKFRAFVETASDLISARDLQGFFTYASPNWKTLLGHEAAAVQGRHVREFVHPEDLPSLEHFTQRLLSSRSSQSGLELRLRHRDGSWRWHVASGAPLLDSRGEISGLLSISHDVTESRQSEERIRHLAQFDALTDLPNRLLVFDRLGQALTLARRHQRPLALLFIDLDDFKPINDGWGHAEGDAVLVEVGRRLRSSVRSADTVGRVGGDEFLVVLHEVDGPAGARVVAEKILEALRRPIEVGDRRHRISSSIGLALYPEHGEDADTLTNRADTAMYAAKAAGRDRVRVYSPELRSMQGPGA